MAFMATVYKDISNKRTSLLSHLITQHCWTIQFKFKSGSSFSLSQLTDFLPYTTSRMAETSMKKNSTSKPCHCILFYHPLLRLVTFSTNFASTKLPVYFLKGKRDLALYYGRVKNQTLCSTAVLWHNKRCQSAMMNVFNEASTML